MYRNQSSHSQQGRSPFHTAEFRQQNRSRSRSRSPGVGRNQASHNTTRNGSSVHYEHLWGAI